MLFSTKVLDSKGNVLIAPKFLTQTPPKMLKESLSKIVISATKLTAMGDGPEYLELGNNNFIAVDRLTSVTIIKMFFGIPYDAVQLVYTIPKETK